MSTGRPIYRKIYLYWQNCARAQKSVFSRVVSSRFFCCLFHLYDGVRGSEKLVGKEGKKLGVFPLGVYTYLENSRKTILIFSDCFREFFWEKMKQISQDMCPTKSFTLIEDWMSYLHQALSLLQNIKLLVKIQQQRLEEAFPNYQHPSRLREDASRKASEVTT